MRISKKLLALPLSLVLLAGCTNLAKLKRAEFTGTEFDNALASEYLAFSSSEADQFDWVDSHYFSRKGLEAASGFTPSPELPETWNVPEDSLPRLTLARGQLLTVLTSDERLRLPQKAARLQLLYDCWVEQEEETWQNDHIHACQEDFYSTLKEFKAFTEGTAPIEVEKGEVMNEQTETVIADVSDDGKPTNFIVFFDFDNADIPTASQHVIDKVKGALDRFYNYNVTLEGHADRAGTEMYNENLSQRRAVNVKQALVESGVEKSAIGIKYYGEGKPHILTEDGIREQLNRRVVIQIDGETQPQGDNN